MAFPGLKLCPAHLKYWSRFLFKSKFCHPKFLNSGQSTELLWSCLALEVNQKHVSKESTSLSKEDDHRLTDVKRIRDVLIKSKYVRRAIGDGDLLPEALARSFCSYYQKLDEKAKKLEVFTMLAKELGVNHAEIRSIAMNIGNAKERGLATDLKLEEKLQHSVEPPYIILLSYIGRCEGGVKFIVDLRRDLLDILFHHELECARDELNAMNHHIRSLLSMWFSVGFLKMERVTWHSPCDITEKVANYEAVHEVTSWMDMKKRIGPYRRCYVFMHPSMPREPVCVLHVALRHDVPASIEKILTEDIPSDERDIEKTNTAVFYSVSSTRKGLAEIELGNSLIKQAVDQLKRDLPNIENFVTLSPIPGFRKWLDYKLMENSASAIIHGIMEHESLSPEERKTLEAELSKPYNLSLKELLSDPAWLRNWKFSKVLRKPLMQICASYLYHEKKRGYAYDPVANFHLRNGAILWRLNWMANVSNTGTKNSLGMMVNYRYILDEVDSNRTQYVSRGKIAASDLFSTLLPP